MCRKEVHLQGEKPHASPALKSSMVAGTWDLILQRASQTTLYVQEQC